MRDSDVQDAIYAQVEADAFFNRWRSDLPYFDAQVLRPSKQDIHGHLAGHIDFNGKRVLEIGPFIGDYLAYLKREHQCSVSGIEPSLLACDFARSQYGLELECSTLAQSALAHDPSNEETFDLIVADDVLSWVSRHLILDAVARIDALLKPGGLLFLRDFSPQFGFAVRNRHVATGDVYNFKQPGGHRQFFLMSGMYVEVVSSVRQSDEYQKVVSSRPDSTIWADSVLQKLEDAAHPVVAL